MHGEFREKLFDVVRGRFGHNFIRNKAELLFSEKNFFGLGKFNEYCKESVVFVGIFLIGRALYFDFFK